MKKIFGAFLLLFVAAVSCASAESSGWEEALETVRTKNSVSKLTLEEWLK